MASQSKASSAVLGPDTGKPKKVGKPATIPKVVVMPESGPGCASSMAVPAKVTELGNESTEAPRKTVSVAFALVVPGEVAELENKSVEAFGKTAPAASPNIPTIRIT